jgi:hypothetical protein
VLVEEFVEYEAMAAGADLLTLDDLLRRPAWHADAAGTEHPEVDFFPTQGGDLAPARAVCAHCLVWEPCLEAALSRPANEVHGIWAGTSKKDRRDILRDRAGVSDAHRAPAAPRRPREPIICDCGAEIPRSKGPGAPRRMCDACRALLAA